MAPKREDDPKFNGHKALANQNFGRSVYNESYLASVWQGATAPFHFGGEMGYVLGCAAFGLAACCSLVSTDLSYEGADLPIAQIQHEDTSMDAFRYQGQRILLQQNTDGEWAIYNDTSVSDIDDMYVLVDDEKEALDISLKYQNHFNDVMNALNTNLGNMPETVPYLLSYEGFSDYYIDGDNEYLLADNAMQRESADFVLTQTQATESYDLWQSVTMSIVMDDYDPIENFQLTQLPEKADPFPDMFEKWLATMGVIYGGAIGLGTIGGAATGTIRSRKRYERALKHGY